VRRWLAGLVAVAALALLAAGVVLGQVNQSGDQVSAIPSSANLGPRGLAALRTLLQETGAVVETRRPGEPAVAGAAVVLLAAPPAQLAREDVESLLAGADAGATLVVALGRNPQPALLAALGMTLSPGDARRTARGVAPHRLVGDLSLPGRSAGLALSRPGGLAVSGEPGWASAVSIPVGRGEVLVFSGPEPFENANLLQGDAVSLAVRLGALGRVVLDERFLVAADPAALPSRRALLLLAGQLLAAGLALLWARGRRLGAIRPPPPPGAGRTARDYLASLAALYRRAGAEEELAAQAWRGLRRRLDRRWGIPARLPDAQVARRVAGRSRAAELALARGGAALADGGSGVLLEVTRAAADVEAALGARR
jgi:hypothetical protein